MQPRSSRVNLTEILAADTSAVIDIIASGHAVEIIEAIPNRFIVTAEVVHEVEAGRDKDPISAGQLYELIRTDRAEVVAMNKVAEAFFEELTVGPARDTLHDGEAATIAIALECGGIPLIDERKARRICRERYPDLCYGCAVDIFMYPEVREALGEDGLVSSVLNALRKGRMRVLPKYEGWVVNLIGSENAAKCSSLSRAVSRLRGGGS